MHAAKLITYWSSPQKTHHHKRMGTHAHTHTDYGHISSLYSRSCIQDHVYNGDQLRYLLQRRSPIAIPMFMTTCFTQANRTNPKTTTSRWVWASGRWLMPVDVRCHAVIVACPVCSLLSCCLCSARGSLVWRLVASLVDVMPSPEFSDAGVLFCCVRCAGDREIYRSCDSPATTQCCRKWWLPWC